MRSARGTRFVVLAGMLALSAALGLLGATPVVASGVLLGCTSSGQLFTVDLATGHGTWVYNLPTYGSHGATEIEFDNLTGNAWVQGHDGHTLIQGFNICNGAPTTDIAFDEFIFTGLEFVGPRLYGTGMPGQCTSSELRVLDPFTGASYSIGPTGMGPISGLALDPQGGVMYGTTGCINYVPSQLVRIDFGMGYAQPIGPTGIVGALGGLEFGPDGNLYGGGNMQNGGNIYRINKNTGQATLVGPSGFPNITGLALCDRADATAAFASSWGRIKGMYR